MTPLASSFAVLWAFLLAQGAAASASDAALARRPLIVLSDRGDLDDSFRPALLTAFALYDDGTVIRRADRTTLRQTKLPAQLRTRLIAVLKMNGIAAASKETPVIDIGGQPGSPSHADIVELHVWIDGSRHTITIRGVTTADLELCAGKSRCPNARLLKGKALFPDAVISPIIEMFRFPLPSGQQLCREAACFSRDLRLPSQDAWTSH